MPGPLPAEIPDGASTVSSDLKRAPTFQTKYMDMLLSLDAIPRSHNILVACSTWIFLAGFVIFPGTFTSLKSSDSFKEDTSKSKVEQSILHTVNHTPLLWVAGACCVTGILGMAALWFKWRRNYIWLISRIFLPGLLNSIAGLISTLINVYTARHGHFSLTATVTTVVTGVCTAVFTGLFFLYNNYILEKVRKGHHEEWRKIQEEKLAMNG